MRNDFDAIVIGGGPAGTAAATVLAQRGLRVVVADSRAAGFKPGESVAPGVKPLLRELGLLERFVVDGHLTSYGNLSAWGRAELTAVDFIRNPHGFGYHVDRARFDEMLACGARDAGAVILDDARVVSAAAGEVHLAGGVTMSARFVIDASGRGSWLAKRMGATRIDDDALLAYVAVFESAGQTCVAPHPTFGHPLPEGEGFAAPTLIESTRDGWWYTAPLPDGRCVAVFHTDRNLAPQRDAATFRHLLRETKHVRERCVALAFAAGDFPVVHRANSGRLDRVYGDDWAAAGDAAISFDPLSSQGILTSLFAGMRLGAAVASHLDGDRAALPEYARVLSSIYVSYLHQHRLFYGAERRWPESPFWQRRHARSVPTPAALRQTAIERKSFV